MGVVKYFRIAIIGILLVFAIVDVSSSREEPNAPAGSIRVSVDRESVAVGEIFHLFLEYTLPKDASLPEKLDVKGLESIEIIDVQVDPDRISFTLLMSKVEGWSSGEIILNYLDDKKQPANLKADPVSIQVLTNLGDKPNEAELKPIEGILPTERFWPKYVVWVVAGLCMLLAGTICFLWYRSRQKKLATATEKAPPHVQARTDIERLESRRLFEQGEIKKFYYLFSAILKRYLEELRGFPAAEFTTEEISGRITREQDRKVLVLLQQADVVKFADAVPTQSRKEEAVEAALAYIKETEPTGDDENGTSGRGME